MMEVGRGDSAAAGGSHAGPLGLHLVTLAPPSPAPTAGLGLWLETAGCSQLGGPKGASFISWWGASHCGPSRGAPLFSFGQGTLFRRLHFDLLGLGVHWGVVGGLQELSDGAHGLGAAFPEHQPLVYVQVLGGLDEAEMNGGLVSSAQTVLIHAQDGGRLPDAPTVHHGLVPRADCGGVMKDQDLGLKLPGSLGIQAWRNHHHALPDG